MNIMCIGSNIFDVDEVISSAEYPGFLQLVFKNGDQMDLPWRDEFERKNILDTVPLKPV